MVLFFKHIPFVVNETINATPPERLQHSQWLCLVIEKAYYIYIVLALRLPGVFVGYYLYLRIFVFYGQCSTLAGVSQTSSNDAREIRISPGYQSY